MEIFGNLKTKLNIDLYCLVSKHNIYEKFIAVVNVNLNQFFFFFYCLKFHFYMRKLVFAISPVKYLYDEHL